MNHKKSDNGNPKDPFYGLLDNGPDDDLAPMGELYDLFWYFTDQALIDPEDSRNNGYLEEARQMLYERIERLRIYELEAMKFRSTSDLLKWIRSSEDRMAWAWSNRTYSRLLQESK
jgi:hypothetical protein